MKRIILPFLVLVLCLFPSRVLADGDIQILTPEPNAGVKGRVVITGYIKTITYTGYDLDFADESNPVPGWYPIASETKIADDGTLGIWDTSTISDGIYSIRLTVYFKDGTTGSAVAQGIRVRNYSPMETMTPAEENVIADGEPTVAPVSLLPSSREAAPAERNPAEVSDSSFKTVLTIGLAVGVLVGALLTKIFSRGQSE